MSDTSLIHDPNTNVPDYAAEESARLAREYKNLKAEVDDLIAEAKTLPPVVTDVEIANLYTRTISRFNDISAKVETFREGEKLPHLRRGTAIDSFFGRINELLFKKKKTDMNGAGDTLAERLHAYNVKRLEAERLAREETERLAREAEAKARREREQLERAAREAAEKAARARNAENRAKAEAAARAAAEAAAAAEATEDARRAERQDATAAAQAKPADLVRERHSDGAMNTMRMVWHVEIEDSMKLDPVTLWGCVKDDHKLAALKLWAKLTNYKKSMAGAIIEERPETVTRR